jgi:hypothetical protein
VVKKVFAACREKESEKMSGKIEDQLASQVAKYLPDVLAVAITNHKRYAARGEQDTKDFVVRQNACKAAVAHIELMVKLARLIDRRGGADIVDGNNRVMLDAMMREAEAELELYGGDEKAEPDEGDAGDVDIS